MNCKAGDLAIIIKGPWGHSPHIGKIVKVLRPCLPSKAFGAIWIVQFSSPVGTMVTKSNGEITGDYGVRNECHAPDDCLRPIRAAPASEGCLRHEEDKRDVVTTVKDAESEQIEVVA